MPRGRPTALGGPTCVARVFRQTLETKNISPTCVARVQHAKHKKRKKGPTCVARVQHAKLGVEIDAGAEVAGGAKVDQLDLRAPGGGGRGFRGQQGQGFESSQGGL